MAVKSCRTLLAVVVAILIMLIGTPAFADDDEEVVVISFGERALGANGAVLLEVELQSKRAVAGDLVVEAQSDSGNNLMYPVSLSAGETYRQIVSADSAYGGLNANFAFVRNGKVLASEMIANTNRPQVAIATLGIQQQDSNKNIDLNLNDNSNSFAGIRGVLFELDNFTTLTSFEVLVAEPSALRSLGENDLQQLISWVSVGGSLQVAGEPNSVDILPEGWQNATDRG